jgi:hypothetical protein
MTVAIKPPRSLVTAAAEAIRDFDLIRNGDRILVGVSGGKDSLSLLHVLLHLKARAPVRFELGAANIDPQMPGYDPSPLPPGRVQPGARRQGLVRGAHAVRVLLAHAPRQAVRTGARARLRHAGAGAPPG